MLEALKLDEVDISDKFLMMEELWSSMSKNASDNGFSPKWHIDLLNEREKKVQDNESKFSTILEAKERLRKSIHEN